MKTKLLLLASLFIACCLSCTKTDVPANDWLIDGNKYTAQISEQKNEITLSNGLVSRTLHISPNAATTSLQNITGNANLLRSVRPEAQLVINGVSYPVGGLTGQQNHSYLLKNWIGELKADSAAFRYTKHSVRDIQARFDWKPHTAWISNPTQWAPKGKELIIDFTAPNEALKGVTIQVHYEIYDGLPLLCKWFSLHNNTGKQIVLNRFTSEILAAVEGESSVEGEKVWDLPNIHVETDYAFASQSFKGAMQKSVHWSQDSIYNTQVSYSKLTPCLLEVYPEIGPEQTIDDKGTFESFRTWMLIHDSYDKERKGLAVRKMYRTIAPWTTENPMMMHVRKADTASVKLAIDQCAEVGFELVILTFGSGFKAENNDPDYLNYLKKLADYAHSKNIALGGYSLLASRSIDADNDVVNPATGKTGGIAYFGNSPCIGSEWGQQYFAKLYNLYKTTGMDILEHDGSYPGDICGSEKHPGHKGLNDSQWTQYKTITDFYKWCRANSIYLNVPDWYYLSGSNKCGMGYREANWSLPRAEQEIIERQNIYDGTWTKAPSMGWMFVPLTEYQGGGAAATIEPLHEHIDHYSQRFANLFGAGVQACFRGPRLYDTDSVKIMVKSWVDFYKAHRAILDSDFIHLRRADGQDWDGWMHVNPSLNEKGFAMLYNPLNEPITRTISLPLYYTGLTNKANIAENGKNPKTYKLNRNYEVQLTINVPAKGHTWLIIK